MSWFRRIFNQPSTTEAQVAVEPPPEAPADGEMKH
jgi:hypothetical protein